MDQRRHGRWSFHRVGQPSVQEQLRRFTHSADEQQEGKQVGGIPICPKEMQLRLRQLRGRRKHIIHFDAVSHIKQPEYTQGKAKITDTVNNKRLDGRSTRTGFFVIESDQQIGRNAHALPTEKHLNQIISRNQRQHGKGKERQIGKETRLIFFVLAPLRVVIHVAKTVKMHHGRNRRHHHQHNRR